MPPGCIVSGLDVEEYRSNVTVLLECDTNSAIKCQNVINRTTITPKTALGVSKKILFVLKTSKVAC